MNETKDSFNKSIEWISNLEPYWDDETEDTPSKEVVELAKMVFDALFAATDEKMLPISVSPLCSGGIDFYWATRKSEDELYCGKNLIKQFLLSIKEDRIGLYGTMNAWDNKADTKKFEGKPEEFFELDLKQFNKFIT